MQLYFAPLACSLAARIALDEAGAKADFIQVNTQAKRTADGADFLAINPMGQVPVLRTDDGAVLTENSAVLQFIADRFPQAQLAPADGIERARLHEWLGFIGTELHKGIFAALFDRKAAEEVKAHARERIPLRFDVLERRLQGRQFLLDRFTVADAYLVAILNWTRATGIDLKPWPAVLAYYQALLQRPSIARAAAEEFALYQQEQARTKAA